MICQGCGIEAPTQKVLFVQHIGAVVMFFHKRIGGLLCRDCVNKYFRQYAGTTLVLGCWGIISMFATPVVLLIDVINYVRAWNLTPVPPGATVPQLTDTAIERLQPFTQDLISRLNAGEPLEQVAASIAGRASVTPGQVVVYLRALIEHSKKAPSTP